jgi:hypothetical protein
MKITKETLKQLIKEELSTVLEQQSPEDLERQAELTADADAPRQSSGRPSHTGQLEMIQLLTDIKALMQQLVQKP